jgi:myo-inositol-1-phosphate synthase
MLPTPTTNTGNAELTSDVITSTYTERFTQFGEGTAFQNITKVHEIKTDAKVPKLGVMIVGLGGNNGSTFTAGLLANKHNISWESKRGTQQPNFYGSFTQCATTHCGYRQDAKTGALEDVCLPIKDILPMVDPTDILVGGWDISNKNLYESCKRAQVLEPDLIEKLKPYLEEIKPNPAAFNQEFIAANQKDRVNNTMNGTNRDMVDQIREDIRFMKNRVEKVVLLWSANTECMYYPEIDDFETLTAKLDSDCDVPASVLYCVAAIEEGILYLNGSPQNTFHPAIVEYAREKGAFIAGSDFKSGQTRFKTVMSDFIIGSGLKLASVVSYNHLGNNDGKNLKEEKCFKSKQISKAGVLDDAIKNNKILYPKGDDKIDHEVVIKYVPFVGDSKRALDEYSSLIFMNGINTISSYNICEDSLLAVPLMYDMILLGELFTRMTIDGEKLGPVLSYLSFFFKAPITNRPEYVINSFGRQREMLVNFLKAAAGMNPDDATLMNYRF